jgi:hypothetical protein
VEQAVSDARIVRVWSKPYAVDVYQESKTVWIAVGNYMGHLIEAKGSNEASAIALWQEAARYKGN